MELTYADNLKQSEKSGKMVVLLGASWCAPCKQMRSKMNATGVAFTYLDIDVDDKDLRETGSVPELVVFTRSAGAWSRKTYVGVQPQSVLDGLK